MRSSASSVGMAAHRIIRWSQAAGIIGRTPLRLFVPKSTGTLALAALPLPPRQFESFKR
jgi:hypothetical protein